MKPNKVLFPFITTSLFTLAFIMSNLPLSTHVVDRIGLRIVTPTPSRNATSTPFSAELSATPIPLWVTGFAEPIIESVADRRPDFQDNFSINRRWFNIISGSPWPLYAEIHDGLLFLRLPEKTKDSILINSKLNYQNFVLTLDLWFDHSQPEDTVRFQFDQSKDQSVALDLSNNRNWKLSWGSRDNWQSISGIYEHFPPESIPVTIIIRGTECAMYLNDDPITYLSNCRPSPTSQSHIWSTTFRLLRDGGPAVTVNFDNLKLWDLDKIRTLPKIPTDSTLP